MKNKRKPYWEMNASELRKATRRYDRRQLGTPGEPLTRERREALRRGRKQRAIHHAASG